VAYDGTDKEAVVGDLCPLLDARGSQVQVHLVVGAGHGRQVEVPHAVQLQLEGQRRLQVTVDAVLLELSTAVAYNDDNNNNNNTGNNNNNNLYL